MTREEKLSGDIVWGEKTLGKTANCPRLVATETTSRLSNGTATLNIYKYIRGTKSYFFVRRLCLSFREPHGVPSRVHRGKARTLFSRSGSTRYLVKSRTRKSRCRVGSRAKPPPDDAVIP